MKIKKRDYLNTLSLLIKGNLFFSPLITFNIPIIAITPINKPNINKNDFTY